MSNLTNTNVVTTDVLLQNFVNFKSNPNLVQQYTLNMLQGITNGQVDIVDPTNPFIFLLEASVVNTAAGIQESVIATQELYASLARTPQDLYKHMADDDYIDVFSTPSTGEFIFMINLADIIKYAVPVPGESYSKVTIPANSYSTIEQYTFTLLYPIDILYYNNGTFLVQLDNSRPNPLQPLSSYILDHTTVSDSDGSNWLQFKYDILQIVIDSNQYTLLDSVYFQETIPYVNTYYYCRVFYLNSTTDEWVPINVTYTQQVFDPTSPTALVQVLSDSVVVNIPQVYYSTGLIESNIRIDVYTTLGEIDVQMSSFGISQYTNVFTAINQNRLNAYTTAMNSVGYLWYSTDNIAGGVTSESFSTIRNNLINNSLNGRLLPITNAQVQSYNTYNGFTLVDDVDVVTDRQFKAIQSAPPSSNTALVPTITTSILPVSINQANLPANNKVLVNTDSLIITPETILLNNEGQVTLLSNSQRADLNNLSAEDLVNQFNNNQYLYSPFYYLIDYSTDNLITMAFMASQPSLSNLNYVSNNNTTGYKVSTNSYAITKISSGYLVTLVNTGDASYLKLSPSEVFCQLAFIPYGQTTYAYMTVYANSTMAVNGGFVFQFYINSGFLFDINQTLDVPSFTVVNSNTGSTPRIPLSSTINIMYGTNQKATGYQSNNVQTNIFSNSFTGKNATVINHETITLSLATYLSNLYLKSTLIPSETQYLTYPNNVPLLYSEPVFEKNPVNGSIFNIVNGTIQYNVLHNVGDNVLDENGDIVYSHYEGDLVLDANGNPIPIGSGNDTYILDMVFYDGVYRIATDPVVSLYVNEATLALADYATTSMDAINEVLFEQTNIYYSPTNSNTSISCYVNNGQVVNIPSNLTPTVNVYLSQSSYNSSSYKAQLETSILNSVNAYLQNTVLSNSELITTLMNSLNNVKAISVSGFWDTYDVVSIINPQDTFVLDVVNYLESSNIIGVKSSLAINFYVQG